MRSDYRVYRYEHLEAPVVTAGSAAVLIGAQNGLFPDMGYAVPGEMGGLWAGERKVCDGFFFAIDDVPLTQADACEIHPALTAFHYRMQKEQLHVVRSQFIPDGVGGCVIELTIENLRPAPRMVEVSYTVRTDIMTVAAAHGEDGMELGRDVGEYDEKEQAFFARDSRNPWHAVWGADKACRALQADLPQTVYGFGNTQGKGVNGRLFYRMRIAAGEQKTMRLYVAGGYPSRSKAEEALAMLRENAETLKAQKQTRIAKLMENSAATLPSSSIERSLNWTKLYADWLTRDLSRGGCALSCDLPEHPALYGEGWARAMETLLPLGGAARVTQVGGERESAQFVALVHQTLLWSGDRAFAEDMLPVTGLCIHYLRRTTRGFEDIQPDLVEDIRAALVGQAYILRMTGAEDAAIRALIEKLPAQEEQPEENLTLAQQAMRCGEQAHIGRMIGKLGQMVHTAAPGLPGSIRTEDAAPGVLLQASAGYGLVRTVFNSLFGIRPDAGKKEIFWHPHTPIGWEGWQIENVKIGGDLFNVKSERVSPSQARYTLTTDGQGWRVKTMENGEIKETEVNGELSLVMED